MEYLFCAICKEKMPALNERGEHNFCPSVLEKSRTENGVWRASVIKDICIKCKIREVLKSWKA